MSPNSDIFNPAVCWNLPVGPLASVKAASSVSDSRRQCSLEQGRDWQRRVPGPVRGTAGVAFAYLSPLTGGSWDCPWAPGHTPLLYPPASAEAYWPQEGHQVMGQGQRSPGTSYLANLLSLGIFRGFNNSLFPKMCTMIPSSVQAKLMDFCV